MARGSGEPGPQPWGAVGGGGAGDVCACVCSLWRGEILARLFSRQVDAQGAWVEGSS